MPKTASEDRFLPEIKVITREERIIPFAKMLEKAEYQYHWTNIKRQVMSAIIGNVPFIYYKSNRISLQRFKF